MQSDEDTDADRGRASTDQGGRGQGGSSPRVASPSAGQSVLLMGWAVEDVAGQPFDVN